MGPDLLSFPVWVGVDSQTNEDAALRLSYLTFLLLPGNALLGLGGALHHSGDCVPTERGGLLGPPFFSAEEEGCKWGNV